MLRKVSVTLEACEMKLSVLACLALFAILVSSPWVLARRAELLQDRETPSGACLNTYDGVLPMHVIIRRKGSLED